MDVLLISSLSLKARLMGLPPLLYFAHPQYCIIPRDRKKGGGGLLVYIRSNVTAHRQINFEPEGVESICLDVKGDAINWFLISACYRSPGKCKITDFIPACASAAERMYINRKEIQSIVEMSNNLNLVDIWRVQHPSDARFTWRNSSGKIRCRLDYWLISRHLRAEIRKYRESADRSEKTFFFFFHQKNPFG